MKNVIMVLLLAGLGVSLFYNYKSGVFGKSMPVADSNFALVGDKKTDSLRVTFKIAATKELVAAIRRMPATSSAMPEQTYSLSASIDCIDESGQDCLFLKGGSPTLGGGTIPNDFFKLVNTSIRVLDNRGVKIKLRQFGR